MTVNDYPEFVQGQSLTAPELNSLTDHLRYRDTLVARMVGFGVNAGLGGAFAGSTLTINPGLAIDQGGEPLYLDVARTQDFPMTPATTEYPFIDSSVEGYSAVLEAYQDPPVSPTCSETTCAGHAKVHTAKVRVRFVKGRIKGTWMNFAAEELLAQTPLAVSLTSNTSSTGATLAAAIAKRLRNGTEPDLVSTASIAVLDTFSIASTDIPGAKGYKAGWINMVLFATLDLLRARALFGLDALHSASPAGVVLGWVHYDGSWKFDCSYRHAWEPPRGFAEAFLGGTCTNPYAMYEDRLVSLLNGYSPPVPPPTTGGGGGKPPVVVKCPKGGELVKGKCLYPTVPPKKIPDHWYTPWITYDPKVPVWNPPNYFTDFIDVIYEEPPLNYFNDGILDIVSTVGYGREAAEIAIKDVIEADGGVAVIKTVTATQATGLDGYLPSSGASPSDTIVLTVDANDKVIATGRVAALTTAKQAGTLVPQAQAAVEEVRGIAAEASQLQGQITTQLAGYDTKFAELSGSVAGIRQQMLDFETSMSSPTAYGVRITTLEQQYARVTLMGDRLSVLEGKFAVGGGTSPVHTYNSAQLFSEFSQTTLEALKTIDAPGNRTLESHIKDAERLQGQFELATASGNQELASDATLKLLDSLRTAVGSAGIDTAAKRKLDVQFREVKKLIG